MRNSSKMKGKLRVDNRGYSLIELLVITTIIVILSTLTSLAVVRYIKKSRFAKDQAQLSEIKASAMTYYNMYIEKFSDTGAKNIKNSKKKYQDCYRGEDSYAEKKGSVASGEPKGNLLWSGHKKFMVFYFDNASDLKIDAPVSTTKEKIDIIGNIGTATPTSKAKYKMNVNDNDGSLGVAVCLIDAVTGETRVGWAVKKNGKYSLNNVIWQETFENNEKYYN